MPSNTSGDRETSRLSIFSLSCSGVVAPRMVLARKGREVTKARAIWEGRRAWSRAKAT